MSYRLERVASVVRFVVSDAISNRLSDPRVSALASVTRVQVSGDLRQATVYVSVVGSESEERKTIAGLEHARGYIQGRLGKRLNTRHCPTLHFRLDRSIKLGSETNRLIAETMAEEGIEQPDAGRTDPHGPEVARDGENEAGGPS
jgi:ribosome-binding factor A